MPRNSSGAAKPPKARSSGQSSTAEDKKSLHGETDKTFDLAKNTVEPGDAMTGNQGVKISDDQNSGWKAGGAGSYPAGRLSSPRKDHAFRSRAHSGAGGPTPAAPPPTASFRSMRTCPTSPWPASSPTPHARHRFSCAFRPLPDRAVRPTSRAMCALRSEILHGGRRLGPGRQQHPGLLYPGRDQVSRPHPCGEARAEQRNTAGSLGHDTFWDFVSLTPESAHMLMWVMSDRALPAQLRHDGRLWRAHLPSGQCGG